MVGHEGATWMGLLITKFLEERGCVADRDMVVVVVGERVG